MTALTVWRFGAADAAERALPRLEAAIHAGIARVDDAALVAWPADGRGKPSARGLGSITGAGRLWGGFWGVLLALVFLAPIAGPTFGAAAGAVAGSLADFGVADDFLKRVRESVTPGTSAIFVISTRVAAERLAAELDGLTVEVLRSDLSHDQERLLRDTLGEA